MTCHSFIGSLLESDLILHDEREIPSLKQELKRMSAQAEAINTDDPKDKESPTRMLAGITTAKIQACHPESWRGDRVLY